MPNRNISHENPFYSPLSEALAEAQGAPKLAPAEQWKGWLDGLQRRGEIRKEEREDMGIDAFLSEQPSHVSKQQLMAHVEGRRPKLSVKVPGGGEDQHRIMEHMDDIVLELPDDEDLWDQVHRVAQQVGDGSEQAHGFRSFHSFRNETQRHEFMDDFTADSWGWFNNWLERQARERANTAVVDTEDRPGSRYSTYQLPGGEKYNEHVVTVPSGPQPGDPNPEEVGTHMVRDRITGKVRDAYQSPHWDEPNVLVHYRSNERPVQGEGEETTKRALHIEEVQSDWHQAGREKGYWNEGRARELAQKAKVLHVFDEGSSPERMDSTKAVGHEPAPQDKKEFMFGVPDSVSHRTLSGFGSTEEEARKDLASFISRSGRMDEVPDAPHKKSWPLLAVKHAIYRAAVDGHSRVSWTPGDEQNRRYPGRDEKDQAGMKKFYDEILPNIVNDYIKKFGAKVQKGAIKLTQKQYPDSSKTPTEVPYTVPLHYFDVTPEMRVAVLHGQPTH